MTVDEVTRTSGAPITGADLARVIEGHERVGRSLFCAPVFAPTKDGADRFFLLFRDPKAPSMDLAPPRRPDTGGGFSW